MVVLTEKLIQEYLNNSSKHKIEKIISIANDQLKTRFKKIRKPKYGHLSKYITQTKWERILKSTTNDKFRFTFYIMRKLALRVGEAPQLNIKNIDLKNKQIFIPRTEKSHMPDMCYLDNETTQKLKEWIEEHNKDINTHQGYLFYPSKKSHSKRLNISPNVIRTKFRESVEQTGFQVIYAKANKSEHNLNLYSTHSCRHSGITDFYARTKDIHKTMVYARIHSVNTMMTYLHATEKDMRDCIDYENDYLDKKEFQEFLHIYHQFKIHRNNKSTETALS
jgi:integrase